METPPGWKMTVNEVSYGVYKITLTDVFGRIAEATATEADFDAVVEQVKGYAFDIEKQLSDRRSS